VRKTTIAGFVFWLLAASVSFSQLVKVKRVIDGDTFIAEEGDSTYHVRMLYIDTPESVHPDKKRNIPLGKIASDWTKNCLEGKTVRLVHPEHKEERDVFNRKLELVFLSGSCINVELVRIGLSPYYTKYGKAQEPWHGRFQEAEKEARDSLKGIWSNPKLTKKYLRLKAKWGQHRH
jgi:micrococcal nuclease